MFSYRRISLGKILFAVLCGMIMWLVVDTGKFQINYLRWQWYESNPIVGFIHQLSVDNGIRTIPGLFIPEIGYIESKRQWKWDKQDPSYAGPMDFVVEEEPIEETSEASTQEAKEAAGAKVVNFERASLLDFEKLLENNYTITSITQLKPELFDVEQALDMDLSMKGDNSKPQILIFHTHSQEGFADSVEGNPETTIVGVGEYLAKLLREQYGYHVIHDTSVYDLIDGKLDRSAAYTYAEAGLEKILEKNPSIEVIIDLHRDGVDEGNHLVTEVNGKPTARVMFFNGISYTKVNGNLEYLPNAHIEENLAMSLQMKLLGDLYYPGFLRKNYINAYRYCLHYRGKSMLIEAGAQTNTLEEEMNAMEVLAQLLHKLLTGERAYK